MIRRLNLVDEKPPSSFVRVSLFQNLRMEATGEAEIGGLLDKIRPPPLEDAGLEDCALPPDSIQEAFLKAASAVRPHVFSASDDDESDGDCVNDPWPAPGSSGDKLVGIATEGEPPGACAPKKGHELPDVIGDEVVTGGREETPDKVVEAEVPKEADKACVDELQGLKIKESKSKDEDEEEEGERPSLIEICI